MNNVDEGLELLIYNTLLLNFNKFDIERHTTNVRLEDTVLITELNIGRPIKTDLSPIINYNKSQADIYIRHNYFKLNNSVIKVELKYNFNNIYDSYVVQEIDLGGQTIIRANGTTDYNVTIPMVSTDIEKDLVGKTLNIRSNTDNYITVNTQSGVTVNSLDALVLRRKASTVSLVYVGNQEWDVFGELP